jgi:hypothetical protein
MRESIVRPLIVASVLRRFKMNAWLGAAWGGKHGDGGLTDGAMRGSRPRD